MLKLYPQPTSNTPSPKKNVKAHLEVIDVGRSCFSDDVVDELSVGVDVFVDVFVDVC